jgi:hypothetical protein
MARGLNSRGGTNFTKIAQTALLAFGVMAAASSAQASDPVGIYALVDKVVLEPNEKTPERAQVWGTFCFAEGRGDGYGQPKRGYLYYKVNPENDDVSRKEWADLKMVAGTPQIVAFGNRHKDKGELRKADDKPKAADVYPLGFGLQKIRENHWNAAPVKALKAFANKNARNDRKQKNEQEVTESTQKNRKRG